MLIKPRFGQLQRSQRSLEIRHRFITAPIRHVARARQLTRTLVVGFRQIQPRFRISHLGAQKRIVEPHENIPGLDARPFLKIDRRNPPRDLRSQLHRFIRLQRPDCANIGRNPRRHCGRHLDGDSARATRRAISTRRASRATRLRGRRPGQKQTLPPPHRRSGADRQKSQKDKRRLHSENHLTTAITLVRRRKPVCAANAQRRAKRSATCQRWAVVFLSSG